MNIVYINHGIAYRDGDTIYVNKVLTLDNKVYQEVMRHELKHDSGEYSWWDFMLDLKPCSINTQLFCLSHLSTWSSFSPIIRLNGEWRYDMATLFNLGVSMIFGGLICYLIL